MKRVRCPLLRVDPAQKPRLEEIHANLINRLAEARQQGWPGEVAVIGTTLAAGHQDVLDKLAGEPLTVWEI